MNEWMIGCMQERQAEKGSQVYEYEYGGTDRHGER